MKMKLSVFTCYFNLVLLAFLTSERAAVAYGDDVLELVSIVS